MMVSDHQQITELVYRYAFGIDTRNWDLYRAIFTDTVEIDFSSYDNRPATTMRADDWVRRLKVLFAGLAATQHTMTNPIVEVVGDRATCVMTMQAAHLLDAGNDNSWFTIGGYYVDSFERTTSGWLLDGVTLNVLWRRGNDAIMTTARQRSSIVG
jgi:hypothetical protein